MGWLKNRRAKKAKGDGSSIAGIVEDFTVTGPLGFMDRGGLKGVFMGSGRTDDYGDDDDDDDTSPATWPSWAPIAAAAIAVALIVKR